MNHKSQAREKRPPHAARAIGVGTLALLAAACGKKETGEAKPAPQPPSEFERVAARIEASDNPYLGRAQLEPLRKKLKAADAAGDHNARWQLGVQLCFHELRVGDTAAAAERIAEAIGAAADAGQPETPTMALKAKAMVQLRQAEVANCIERHNAECCVFPLAGGGEHQDKAPALGAKSTLLEVLARQPDDRLLQWLLNIACMATGEYPDGVPEQFRIPPEALEPSHDGVRFNDVAPAFGVDDFTLCGGVAVEDFDGDGLLDIATSSSDPRQPLRLHRNLGGVAFEDRTANGNTDDQLGGLNVVAADYDNDGDVDLLVLRGAWLEEDGLVRNSLLQNDGKGRFTDVTVAAGLGAHARPTQSATWGDFDNDGDLDLFIGNESRAEYTNSELGDYPCEFYRNDGDGSFTETTAQSGLHNDRFCKGATAGDYDNDGDLDLYVSNVGKNRLYRNDGGLRFTDVAPALGVTGPEGYSFASWFFDFDNDGWLDLFVAGFKATPADLLADYRGQSHSASFPKLYRNLGDGRFEDIAASAGLQRVFLPMGANFGDIDNDGWLDIYLATGDPNYETLMPNAMLRNVGGRSFKDVTFACGLGHLQKGHGVAFADFDGDGDQDIYNQLGGFFPGDRFHNALFINPSPGGHYLDLELVGTKSNRSAIGARLVVELETPSGPRQLHRAAGSVSSFGGSPISRQHIGLGDATAITMITVDWPTSGETQSFDKLSMDTTLRITEGSPTAALRLTPGDPTAEPSPRGRLQFDAEH